MNANILELIKNLKYEQIDDNGYKYYFLTLESKNIMDTLLENNIVTIDKLMEHFIYYAKEHYNIIILESFLKYLQNTPKYTSYYCTHINEIISQINKCISDGMLFELVVNLGSGLDILINNLFYDKKMDHGGELILKTIKYLHDFPENKNKDYKIELLENALLKNNYIRSYIGLLIYYKEWYKETNTTLYMQKLKQFQEKLISFNDPYYITYYIYITKEEVPKEMEDIIINNGDTWDVLEYLQYISSINNVYNRDKIIEILIEGLKSRQVRKNIKISKEIKNYLQQFEKLDTLSVASFMEYASNDALKEKIDIARYSEFFNSVSFENDCYVECTLKKRKKY